MAHDVDDGRRYSPAAARNRDPIREVLATYLPDRANVLELASGTGEHAIHMAGAYPDWRWQPSDLSSEALVSIEAWRAHAGLANVLPAERRDVLSPWDDVEAPLDAMVAINLIHISPWAVTEALMAKAGVHLAPGGVVFLYGPYRRGGEHTADSNAAFDQDLKRRDPRWGVRDLEAVEAEARTHGLALVCVEPLPANNLAVVFRRD
ncbi:DUF938 domain-containing protein [Halomonas sp. V046]|uniref:DUF938 domain-containing protein n=1 Tax=Halomonas sp. V046 TaxID=3459611 RepID=UPI0040451622